MKHPLVIAITGSSGVIYGQRLVQIAIETGIDLHLVVSNSGVQVLKHELGINLDPNHFQLSQLLGENCPAPTGQLEFHHINDFMSLIASGSHQTSGMVICPCSGATLSSVAHGSSRNLIERAADVHLKEGRPLVLVPREAPLSLIHLDNLRTAKLAGATILPASPGFYHDTKHIDDLVNFIVARILDQLGIEHHVTERWGDS